MDRRTLLKALGMTGAGGAVITSTGAFTSVEANRDVAVQVSDDANAYLAIDDTGNANAEYVTEDATSGEFGLDFTGSNSTPEGGSGVNADAVTVFENLFEVSNQGTQTVETEVTPLSFVESSGSDSTLIVLVVPQTGFPKVTIDPGETETYDLIVTATDAATTSTSLSETITVSGEAP